MEAVVLLAKPEHQEPRLVCLTIRKEKKIKVISDTILIF